MDFDGFLGKMQRLMSRAEQGDMFGDKRALAKGMTELCEEFLKAQGYSIGKPHQYPLPIKQIDDLLKQWYTGIRPKFPNHLWSHSDEKQDRAIAKAFVERRAKEDCISRETALQQCGLIIQTVLDRPDVFRFETAPTFGIFGQAEMGWITDRAIEIINKRIADYEAIETEKSVEEMTERIEKDFPNLGYSLEELQEMNKKLEEQYGKKER